VPVKRRIAKARRRTDVNEKVWAWLSDSLPDSELRSDSEIAFQVLYLECWPIELQKLWVEVREDLLAEWIADHPGSRPRLWWQLDAPRGHDGKLQTREFVTGAGVPAWLISAHSEAYEFGLPTTWGGYDADDPPTFESQAEFLRRHGLLGTSEARRLSPDELDPEFLGPSCEVLLHGPYSGPHADGVAYLEKMDQTFRSRIPEARLHWPEERRL
jgi:hypothetical protein